MTDSDEGRDPGRDFGPDEGDEVEPVIVPAALDGERIDRTVALLTGWSRAVVQTVLAEGGVLVDGEAAAKSLRLRAGQEVLLVGAPASEALPTPDPDLELEVRYEDDDLAVVAKPAGLVTHPGAGHPDGTLVNGALARWPRIASVGEPARPGIVHRLDRDTSGLLIVALSERARSALVDALARRAIERRYVALVWGVPAARRGVIDAPIGRSTARRTRMAVRDAGKPARTTYEVVEQFAEPVAARLDCRLETGRTHQIRVHLAAIGHPVVGDRTYGGARSGIECPRTFLHAAALAFDHPVTGNRIELTEPLPAELAAVLATLRAAGAA
ncbi:MAG: RluA family pseudouridine synthase [Actinomycetota bacterium]